MSTRGCWLSRDSVSRRVYLAVGFPGQRACGHLIRKERSPFHIPFHFHHTHTSSSPTTLWQQRKTDSPSIEAYPPSSPRQNKSRQRLKEGEENHISGVILLSVHHIYTAYLRPRAASLQRGHRVAPQITLHSSPPFFFHHTPVTTRLFTHICSEQEKSEQLNLTFVCRHSLAK